MSSNLSDLITNITRINSNFDTNKIYFECRRAFKSNIISEIYHGGQYFKGQQTQLQSSCIRSSTCPRTTTRPRTMPLPKSTTRPNTTTRSIAHPGRNPPTEFSNAQIPQGSFLLDFHESQKGASHSYVSRPANSTLLLLHKSLR
jgi:hypothetical protein